MDTLIVIILLVLVAETSYLLHETKRKNIRVSKEAIVLDTSVLIDGRIVSIARSGFMSAEVIVLKSVLRELQYMADGSDHDKRERARYGLDAVKELQSIEAIKTVVVDDGDLPQGGVDERLIEHAKSSGARLCTTDYNLNKVARAESILVINVNELAHAIRSVHLPGEHVDVLIVSKGQGKEQGVGYLDDGTMVVVDGGKKYMQTLVSVEVTRMLQTEAGRMVFAKLLHKTDEPISQPKSPSVSSAKSMPKKSIRKYARKPNKRRSPEDAMVDLANQ